jgi:hypothetical protein
MLRPPSKSIRGVMRELWNEDQRNVAPYFPASKYISEFKEKGRLNSYRSSNYLVLNGCLILDEYALFFSAIFCCLRDASKTKNEHELCMKFLFGSLCSQLNCIRDIISLGFDVQARVLSRVFGKYTDLLTLITLDPTLSTEFKKTEGAEDSNVFWHKHLSRGKVKTALKILARSQEEFSKFDVEIRSYQREEETMMSSALHPSFIAAIMYSYGLHGLRMFGSVDYSSIRTMQYLRHRCMMSVMFTSRVIEVIRATETDRSIIESLESRAAFILRLEEYIESHSNELPLSSMDSEDN